MAKRKKQPRKPVIVLSNGYEVDTAAADWPDHLSNALIGSIFVEGVDRADGDWDDRMAVLMLEVGRLCDAYGLSPFAWFCKIIVHLNDVLAQAGVPTESFEPKGYN